MSQENIHVVRTGIEAWSAGDFDTIRELLHPDVVLRAADGWPEPGPYVGREAVVRQWKQMRETFDVNTVEPVSEFVSVADRVLVRYVWRGLGHGPESRIEVSYVGTVRDGKLLAVEFFWDHAAAREAVGLSEEEPPTDA
jgi:ketosteroid isomerase-like protein